MYAIRSYYEDEKAHSGRQSSGQDRHQVDAQGDVGGGRKQRENPSDEHIQRRPGGMRNSQNLGTGDELATVPIRFV